MPFSTIKEALKILLLEDSTSDAEMIQRNLLRGNIDHQFRLATDKTSFLTALKEFIPDVILSDHSLLQFDSFSAMQIAKEHLPNVPFIMVTGTVSEEFATSIIKQGADNYILKDKMTGLSIAIKDALKQRSAFKEIQSYKDALDESAIVDITDEKGAITYVSNNFCKISKYTITELIGQNHKLLNTDYHPSSYFKDLWKTISSGKTWRGEFCNKAKDEEIFWVDTTIIPFVNENKKPYKYLSIRTDITEKKKAEEKLRKTEIRLNETQAIAHISSWEIDIESNISIWSDEFYKILGYHFGEIEPSVARFLSLLHPEDVVYVEGKLNDSLLTQTNASVFYRFIHKDGTVKHAFSKWQFEFDKKGKSSRLFGILQDITERKQAEEELNKSNERFQYATKASSDIIWELNFETKKYLVYEGKEKIFAGQAPDWKTGVEGKYIFHEDLEKVKESFREARMDLTRQFWELEYRVKSTDATIMHIINHVIFIRDEKGKALRAVGAITDITEKKKLEENLLEQQRLELIKITATALEAQEKERNSIGLELHDNVNQILAATNLKLSMIKSKPEKADELVASCMANLRQAIQENRKIAHLFVAPDFKNETLTSQLKKLILNMMKPAGIQAKIIFDNFHEELLDNNRKINIYRIAQEQCSNIVKYSKATTVSITLFMNEKDFKMIIADNGVGTDTKKKNKGIGLKNIKGRLSIFNGTAIIVSAPGKGFTLEIIIPV